MNKKDVQMTEKVTFRATDAMKTDLALKAQENGMKPTEFARYIVAKELYKLKDVDDYQEYMNNIY